MMLLQFPVTFMLLAEMDQTVDAFIDEMNSFKYLLFISLEQLILFLNGTVFIVSVVVGFVGSGVDYSVIAES